MSDTPEPQYAADLHRQGEVATAARPPRRHSKWIGRFVGLIFVGTIVGGAMIGVMKLVNDPATGAISVTSLKQSISPTPQPAGHLGGLYVDMAYPSVFNQVSQIKTDSTALEQYRIGSSMSYRRTITVNVRPLPSGRLSDDSSYRLRELQTAVYAPTSKIINGENAVVMSKNDASEVTFFWYHSGKLLIVSVTTSEPGDHASDFAAMMMTSVKWL